MSHGDFAVGRASAASYSTLALAGIVLAVSACHRRERPPVQPDLQRPHPVKHHSKDRIANLADDLYDAFLEPSLEQLEAELAELPPPPATSGARVRAGVAADAVAIATVRQIGKREIDALKDDLADPIGDLERMDAIGADPSHATTSDVSIDPGGSLLTEFFERERLAVTARLLDESDVLRLVRVSAPGKFPHDFDAIEPVLLAGARDPGLSDWFKDQVAMAWMNLCTRVSRGPGLVVGSAGHGGMIDITVEVSFGAHGAQLQLVSAKNEAGPGAAAALRGARDEHGTPYTLATLPVYRRVWLKTSDSRLDVTPAFVLAPTGELEAQLDDDALAAIGAGREGADVPNADATIGAKLIVSMLRGVRTDEVR